MNWFHKIMLVLTAFVAMLVYFAVKSSKAQLDLVTEKYYEEELKFQERIDKHNNENALTESVAISTDNGKLIIKFPQSDTSQSIGFIKLYCPSNSKNDAQIPLQLNTEGEQYIDISDRKGMYAIQVDWTQNNTSYFKEKKLFF